LWNLLVGLATHFNKQPDLLCYKPIVYDCLFKMKTLLDLDLLDKQGPFYYGHHRNLMPPISFNGL
ncbi:6247_t:CDS:2, partial [Dentiscutata erythropus]